jgi:hypothetical protein
MRYPWGWMGAFLMACGPSRPADVAPHDAVAPTSFADDVAFLQQRGEVQVLQAPEGGRVALSAKYQGRVMTSAVEPNGRSLGWIFRRFLSEGKTGTQFDNYGGEDRFWLGPEGGQYSLFFPPGKPFEFSHWQTPAAFQQGDWAIQSRAADSITFERALSLLNYAGAAFELKVTRTVRLLPAEQVASRVAPVPAGVRWVAFETENRIVNIGKEPWTEDKGLLSVWILAMFTPTPDTFVVVPFDTQGSGPIVNDSYFGKVPADRLQVHEKEGYMVFRCDGQHRSKIGLGPSRARPVLGSYSASAGLLTLVQYNKPQSATRYVNSMWEIQKEPYGGDVVNSYNDGPTEPGKPPLGGFYEMESSSPAAALKPGAELVHRHATFHFVGEPALIDELSLKALGVRVSAVRM